MKTMEKKGFTLIELLIVIAIIGILAVAFLPSLLGAPAKGRDAQRTATLQKIQNFLVTEMLAGHALENSGCITSGAAGIGTLIDNNIANFGGTFPVDPLDGNIIDDGGGNVCTNEFLYVKDPTADYSFGLYAHLETGTGNIACNADGQITAADLGTLSTDADCYAILVQ